LPADLIALERVLARFRAEEYATEVELSTSFLPDLAVALGYSVEQLFFNVWTRGADFLVDAVISHDRLSPPWVVFEVARSSRRSSTTRPDLAAALRETLRQNNAHAACFVSPEVFIAVNDEGTSATLSMDALDSDMLGIFASMLAPPGEWPHASALRAAPDDHLAKALQRMREAKGASEKGKALEDLAEILFADLDGVRVKYRNLLTSSSEIDLILEADPRSCPLLFTDFPRFSLVECKNWSEAVGAREVRDFVSKIEKTGCKLGFFLSRTGVTGANNSVDALREIRFAADRLGTFVIVLAEDDVVRVVEGVPFHKLLDAKFDSIRFDLP
jgi:hypothetical protein